MTRVLASLGLSLLATIVLSLLVSRAVCDGWFPRELILGWAFALFNGAVAFITHRKAVGGSMARFLVWAGAGDLLRLACAVGIVLSRRSLGADHLPPLAITVVLGYLIYMAGDVWLLFTFQGSPGRPESVKEHESGNQHRRGSGF